MVGVVRSTFPNPSGSFHPESFKNKHFVKIMSGNMLKKYSFLIKRSSS